MKTIIAGSRNIEDYILVCDAVAESKFTITEVVSGSAKGIDQLGERWAKENNIPITKFPADWEKYAKKAGYIRNQKMAKYADQLILVWDGFSRGSSGMLRTAYFLGLKVYVKLVSKGGPYAQKKEG